MLIKPLINPVFTELNTLFLIPLSDCFLSIRVTPFSRSCSTSLLSSLQSLRPPHASLIPFYKLSLPRPWEPNPHHGNHRFGHVPITAAGVCVGPGSVQCVCSQLLSRWNDHYAADDNSQEFEVLAFYGLIPSSPFESLPPSSPVQFVGFMPLKWELIL